MNLTFLEFCSNKGDSTGPILENFHWLLIKPLFLGSVTDFYLKAVNYMNAAPKLWNHSIILLVFIALSDFTSIQ